MVEVHRRSAKHQRGSFHETESSIGVARRGPNGPFPQKNL